MSVHKIQISIFDKLNQEFAFQTLESFVDFANQEVENWTRIRSTLKSNRGNLASFSENVVSYFQQALSRVKNWDSVIDTWDQTQLKQNFDANIENNIIRHLSQSWIHSNSPVVYKWIEIDSDFGESVSNYFIDSIFNSPLRGVDKNQFKGAILAYEFEMQDSSIIAHRRKSEQVSLNRLRNDLIKQHTVLSENINSTQQSFKDWFEQCQSKAKRVRRSHHYLARKQRNILDNNFNLTMENWKNDIKNLENIYHEKLRFKGPAQYWKTSASKFKTQGVIWAIVLLIVLLVGIEEFSSFFQLWLTGQKLGIELNTLQGAAIFLTIVSAFVFTVSLLSKLTLSSFHLQRDSEEREQLTHLYLSLSNETDIDNETRKIVLQSLFSRADTGLLGKDGGVPVMPMIDLFKKN